MRSCSISPISRFHSFSPSCSPWFLKSLWSTCTSVLSPEKKYLLTIYTRSHRKQANEWVHLNLDASMNQCSRAKTPTARAVTEPRALIKELQKFFWTSMLSQKRASASKSTERLSRRPDQNTKNRNTLLWSNLLLRLLKQKGSWMKT